MKKVNLLICFFVFFALNAVAQNPVSLSMSVAPGSVAAGGKGTAKISASIGGGWHMYSVTQGAGGPTPTRITLDESWVKMNGVSGSRPHVEMDPNFNMKTETYDGSASFTIPFTVVSDAPSGAQNLTASVRYQVCNDTTCLPPKTVKVSVPLTILATKATPSPTATPKESPTPTPTVSPTPTASPTGTPKNSNANISTNLSNANSNFANSVNVSEANTNVTTQTEGVSKTKVERAEPETTNFSNGGFSREMSLWSFIWAAIAAGFASLLTPCVFPMIPITVSYFTNHADRGKGKAVKNASIFAVGIIFTFTIFGILLAVFFGATGIQNFAANPWVNIFIGGLFLIFAMSLLGAYELGLPASILTKLDRFQRGKESSQFVGLLLMGVVFSLTSFTCTTPLVGGLLALASQGSWAYPILGMLIYSSVFALPFFILALAPQLISQMPRSGGWLNSVKVVMGFLEIAAAMKFVSNVDLVWGWGIFTREVVIASWVAVSFFIMLYLLGFFQLSHDSKPERLGAFRVMIALIFLSFGFYLLTGLFGKTLIGVEAFLPPKIESVTSAEGNSENSKSEWITNDFEKGIEVAKKQNKLIFIDFTGYTCTNCRWMEANMFPVPTIHEAMSKFVRVRLYTDREGQPYEGFQAMQSEKFGVVALPLYAIVTPDGKTLATFPGLTRDENEFLAFLKIGIDATNGG